MLIHLTNTNHAYAQVIKETSATGSTDYLYGDDLIKQSKAANDSYYLYDGLGSTRALTDSIGNITDSYNYESFGGILNQTEATENRYLFTGEQYDVGLDNYYLRARYYEQNIGRFTQQDTWMGDDEDPVTLHKYLCANADPVDRVDPSGNNSFTLVGQSSNLNIQGVLNTVAVAAIGKSFFVSTENGIGSVPSTDLSSSAIMLMSAVRHGLNEIIVFNTKHTKHTKNVIAGLMSGADEHADKIGGSPPEDPD